MNKYTYLAIAGFILWIVESVYFGWNMEPVSANEKFLDSVVSIMLFWGVVGDILKGITFNKVTEYKVIHKDN